MRIGKQAVDLSLVQGQSRDRFVIIQLAIAENVRNNNLYLVNCYEHL
jgi:hypothetical protein